MSDEGKRKTNCLQCGKELIYQIGKESAFFCNRACGHNFRRERDLEKHKREFRVKK